MLHHNFLYMLSFPAKMLYSFCKIQHTLSVLKLEKSKEQKNRFEVRKNLYIWLVLVIFDIYIQ